MGLSVRPSAGWRWAVGSERAAFFGLSEGAAMCSCTPRTLWAPDFPRGRRDDAYDREVDQALRIYGSRGEAREAARRLGMRTEEEVNAYIDLVRWGVSPGMLKALYRMNQMIDVREVLPLVRVPTLVLHGDQDQIVPVEVGEYVARRLRSGRLVVLPGVGHLSLGPEGDGITGEIERFLTDVRETGGWDSAEPDRMLATVLFTDIVESTNRAIEPRGPPAARRPRASQCPDPS